MACYTLQLAFGSTADYSVHITSLTHMRQCRVKLLHGILPVIDRLHLTRPDIDPDNTCPRCQAVTETQDHAWQCEAAQRGWRAAAYWLQDRLCCEVAENGDRIHIPRATVEDTFTRSSVRGVVQLHWERVLANAGIPQRRRKELCRLTNHWVIDAFQDRV